MDQSLLVSSGQKLVKLLDRTPAKPRFAMWVSAADSDHWRLWLVPAKGMNDKRQFYLTVAETLNKNRNILPEFDIGSVEFTPENRPVVEAIRDRLHVPDLDAVDMSGNLLNGVFLSDGILLRSDL